MQIAQNIIRKNKDGVEQFFQYFDDYMYQLQRGDNQIQTLAKTISKCFDNIAQKNEEGFQEFFEIMEQQRPYNKKRNKKRFNFFQMIQDIMERQEECLDDLGQNLQDLQLSKKNSQNSSSDQQLQKQNFNLDRPLLSQGYNQLDNKNNLYSQPLLLLQEQDSLIRRQQRKMYLLQDDKQIPVNKINNENQQQPLSIQELNQAMKKDNYSQKLSCCQQQDPRLKLKQMQQENEVEKEQEEVKEQNHFIQYKNKYKSLEDEDEDKDKKGNDMYKAVKLKQNVQKAKNMFKINKSSSKKHNKKKQQGTQNINKQQESENIFKINKSLSRKQNIKKQKEAQSQMLANIIFLKSIKQSKVSINGLKKQWKQNSPLRKKKDMANSLKMQRKKQISDSLTLIRQQETPIIQDNTLMIPKQSTSFLPELKKQRKKGQIFKPAPYSIYSINQKDNEVFYNNFK